MPPNRQHLPSSILFWAGPAQLAASSQLPQDPTPAACCAGRGAACSMLHCMQVDTHRTLWDSLCPAHTAWRHLQQAAFCTQPFSNKAIS